MKKILFAICLFMASQSYAIDMNWESIFDEFPENSIYERYITVVELMLESNDVNQKNTFKTILIHEDKILERFFKNEIIGYVNDVNYQENKLILEINEDIIRNIKHSIEHSNIWKCEYERKLEEMKRTTEDLLKL